MKCPHCERKFPDANAVWMHSKAKHPGKKNPRPESDAEESMADIFVQAQIDEACGEPVEQWIKDMLP